MTGEELVVTRSSAVPVLRTLIVAPVTRTVRHIPTEIGLDQEHGLAVSCAASFDNLLRVRWSHLTERLGSLGSGSTDEICRALGALADC